MGAGRAVRIGLATDRGLNGATEETGRGLNGAGPNEETVLGLIGAGPTGDKVLGLIGAGPTEETVVVVVCGMDTGLGIVRGLTGTGVTEDTVVVVVCGIDTGLSGRVVDTGLTVVRGLGERVDTRLSGALNTPGLVVRGLGGTAAMVEIGMTVAERGGIDTGLGTDETTLTDV